MVEDIPAATGQSAVTDRVYEVQYPRRIATPKFVQLQLFGDFASGFAARHRGPLGSVNLGLGEFSAVHVLGESGRNVTGLAHIRTIVCPNDVDPFVDEVGSIGGRRQLTCNRFPGHRC
jgi:hypothetical protein